MRNEAIKPGVSLGQGEAAALISSKLAAFAQLLARPVNVSTLATFRFLFGAIMVWEVARYFSHGYIFQYYIEPRFFFTYEFFPFVSPLPGQGMYWLFGAMGLFALGIALGFYYRLSAFLFFLSYTYVFLLDKTPYNNHYYLIILLSFLLCLVDAQRWLSLDRWRAVKPDLETVPFWQLFLLRAQIFIVYFYGGLAKLNGDWLRGEPMRMWLAERSDYPVLGSFFTTEWAVYFFSYGGLFFDLSIGFLLLWRPTRLLAFGSLLFFHLMNNWLFSIGVFPFLALASTLLFVQADFPRRASAWLGRKIFYSWPEQPHPLTWPQPSNLNPWVPGLVLVYLALQLLIPLRHWLYPGNVSWTEEGHRFAWHMKLRDKEPRLEIRVTDPQTGKSWIMDLEEDLTHYQIRQMAARPDMILQYAHYLRAKLWRAGPEHPIITANVWVSLNGRPFQQLIDPTVNLAQVSPARLAHATWILPLAEKLAHPAGPILHFLVVIVMMLANAGLALNLYFILGCSRAMQNQFTHTTHHVQPGIKVLQSLPLRQVQILRLAQLLAGILPYLVILLSLAAWSIGGQLFFLGVAVVAAWLAAGWKFYLAPFRSSSFERPYLGWTAVLIGLLTSLFLLMTIILIRT
jgi:vitamin K-dependent gamma-carboxylase